MPLTLKGKSKSLDFGLRYRTIPKVLHVYYTVQKGCQSILLDFLALLCCCINKFFKNI